MKEWREVTFIEKWVKALYIGYHQELDLPQNLFPFPRTVQLKISLGPIRFLYSKFHMAFKTTHNKDESLPQFLKSPQLIFSHKNR